MNIFVLSEDPAAAASYLCDKHVVKMALESAQILCSPFVRAPYRRTHYNHPCCVWARQSKENFGWLVEHGLAIGEEFARVYSKNHKSVEVIKWCADHSLELSFPQVSLTPFAVVTPDEFKGIKDPVANYRAYYKTKPFLAYKNRVKPSWLGG